MDLRNIGKRGQAAIEFLMTYGWMLLVVLIVGALIFSFVDFGALLPNKLDLSGQMSGDPGRMVANAGTGDIQFVVRYIGGPTISLNASSGTTDFILTRNTGTLCTFTSVTDASGNAATPGPVTMINGQETVFTFNCGTLVPGDVFEGRVDITYVDPRTPALRLRSVGEIRVPITN